MNSSQIENLDYEQLVLDSPEAVKLGFSSARFSGCLMCKDRSICVWRIYSKEPGKGYLSSMFKKMLDSGYTLQVPTPVGRMAEIVLHMGFTRTMAYDPQLEPYEVWVKGPVSESTA
jgi:hypothetical protein